MRTLYECLVSIWVRKAELAGIEILIFGLMTSYIEY